jgi:outer membrane protein
MRLSAAVVAQCLVVAMGTAVSPFSYAQDTATELDLAYGDVGSTDDIRQRGDWRGFLGVGVAGIDGIVGDGHTFLVPIASVTYKDTVYLSLTRAGVWLFKSDDHTARAGLVVKQRRGYDPEDADRLAGMESRDNSVEAGINGAWAIQPVIVSAAFFTDVSGKSDGNSATFGVSRPFRLSDRWKIVPSAGAQWLSADVVDYYYGVKPSEVTATRPAYEGKSTVNLRLGVMAHYRLGNDWSLFGGVGYTWLGSGVADSPIVDRDSVAAVHFGGGWHF